MEKLVYLLFFITLATQNLYSQELLLENYSYGSNCVVLSESSEIVYASFGRSIVGEAESRNHIVSINSSKYFPIKELISTNNNSMDIIPVEYSLQQNYPNPFNPSTNIKFEVPDKSLVSINIYNILGEKVIELVHEEKNAGSYEITWNAHNLSNGVYIYTMRSGNFVDSKKLILLK